MLVYVTLMLLAVDRCGVSIWKVRGVQIHNVCGVALSTSDMQ